MDILTLKSKVKLGCTRCEKCCIYRGDIRISPLNLCYISKFLKINPKEFVEKYTDRVKDNVLEIVLKTIKEEKQCILYNNQIKGCSIHKVKPMQCVMFPLVPENLKRNYFYNSNQCIVEGKEITVDDWLNGNNKIYSRNKKAYIEWINFLEYVQSKIDDTFEKKEIEEYYRIIFENYNLKKLNLKSQVRQNMYKVEKMINTHINNIKNKIVR